MPSHVSVTPASNYRRWLHIPMWRPQHKYSDMLNRQPGMDKSLIIEANETDIEFIAITIMFSLIAKGLEKMWAAFGKEESTQWIPNHDLVSAIRDQRKPVGCCFSMLSLAVMLYHVPMEKESMAEKKYIFYSSLCKKANGI